MLAFCGGNVVLTVTRGASQYVGPPHQQPSGGDTHAYDVMDDLAQRIEPVHRPIEVFEKLDDSLFDGAGPL